MTSIDVGLITEGYGNGTGHPDACKDEKGRLRVAAATGVGDAGRDRRNSFWMQMWT